jgi:hypothetical protein
VRATKQNKDILVSWKVANEQNIQKYEIEKSADSRNFTKVGTKLATGNGTPATDYNWLDEQAVVGANFYRIRSVGVTGEVKSSKVVKVTIDAETPSISIYPNPVKEDRNINIRMTDVPAGVFKASIINELGQTLMRTVINHTGVNAVYPVKLARSAAHGQYLVELTDQNNTKTILKVLY